MKFLGIAICLPALLLVANYAQAQTPYPMLMSVKPTAAQVGATSEHTVYSRYNLYGTHKVLITGDGVTGEAILPEVKKGGKAPNLQQLKVKFTVAQDAKPGVREIRLATPQGVSTVGQLVIVRDPVVVETGKNDNAAGAQSIDVPATVCGAIERAEDVDFFKFKIVTPTSLSFHVRSMRLQNKIHDLQKHSDPIIAVRNAMGTTLATSDNHFYGDPFLSYKFEQPGEYLLEIRDVRYQGNKYWEYSVEINGRPFVSNVFPLAVNRGVETKLNLIGAQLPQMPVVNFTVADDTPAGQYQLQLPLAGGGLSNPVPIVVSDVPALLEAAGDNNTPATAQAIAVPSGVNGRIETEADIDCYAFEAKKGERFSIEVIARRQQSALDSIVRLLDKNGRQLTENDDMKLYKRSFADSWIENWTAPADGKYTIEIRDLHLRGSIEAVYFLKLTRAEPYFELYLDTDKTQLTPGTNGALFVNIVRKNGFTGEVQLALEGLPDGVTALCGRIPEGARDGCIILQAAAEAKMSAVNITVTGTGGHKQGDGNTAALTAVCLPYQETYQPGGGRGHWPVETHTVSVGAPGDIRAVKLSTNDITLKPGESKRIDITIERAPGFAKNVQLKTVYQHLSSVYADTLPAGVSIDGKNSSVVLNGTAAKGHITLKADAKAKPIEKLPTSIMANISINFVMKATYASEPLTITVAKP